MLTGLHHRAGSPIPAEHGSRNSKVMGFNLRKHTFLNAQKVALDNSICHMYKYKLLNVNISVYNNLQNQIWLQVKILINSKKSNTFIHVAPLKHLSIFLKKKMFDNTSLKSLYVTHYKSILILHYNA